MLNASGSWEEKERKMTEAIEQARKAYHDADDEAERTGLIYRASCEKACSLFDEYMKLIRKAKRGEVKC